VAVQGKNLCTNTPISTPATDAALELHQLVLRAVTARLALQPRRCAKQILFLSVADSCSWYKARDARSIGRRDPGA